jgi:hypothetical protein
LRPFASAALAATLAMLLAPPARAQIDYRNLDDERPVATEDAYAVERYAFELLAPYRFEHERLGGDRHVVAPELEYGLIPNGQVSLRVPLAAVNDVGGTQWGLAGIRAAALYNFNMEGPGLPAIAIRTDWTLPVGNVAGDRLRVMVKGIATRSWGRTRLHVNAAVGLGSDDPSAVESPPRWQASAAVDRTLLRQSVLVIGELEASRTLHGAPVQLNAAAGFRWQWTPTLVLDVGVSRRLRSDGPDIGLTAGLSHVFALSGLMPGGRP